MISMTPEQQQSLRQGKAIRVKDSEVGDVVVCPSGLYDHLQEILQDEQDRLAIVRYGQGVTAKRLLEEDQNGQF